MNIDMKFSLGDRLYPIENRPQTVGVKCDICKGVGCLGEGYTCPKCIGTGKQNGNYKWIVADAMIIDSYIIWMTFHKGTSIRYSLSEEFYKNDDGFIAALLGQTWKEDDLFWYECAAQEECKRRNEVE